MTVSDSLRLHPQLRQMFKEAESRHLNEDEFDLYEAVVPEFASRAEAAREVKSTDGAIVKKVIRAIYAVYPYEEKHNLAMAKCVRDVRYVTAYATLAMLMDDLGWYRDKLLIWMKTIIQSFEYPDILPGKKRLNQHRPEVLDHLETLKPHQRSIYECYFSIREEFRSSLSEEAFQEMEPYLQITIDILAHD